MFSKESMLLADQMDIVRVWGQVLSLIFCSAAYVVAAFVVLPRSARAPMRLCCMCLMIVVDVAI